MTIQITLLSKPAFTNRTDKLRFYAAFVLLVPPQRCEEYINAIASRAYMILPRFLPLVVALLALSLVRLPALIALQRFVPQQWRFQGECPATVIAEILTGTRSAGFVTFGSHWAKASAVHGNAWRWWQGWYRPVGRTVCRIWIKKKKREMKLECRWHWLET